MWNYRVVVTVEPDGQREYAICEAYYGEDGHVNGIGLAADLAAESRQGLADMHAKMFRAFHEPTVEYDAATETLREPDQWLHRTWPTRERVEHCQREAQDKRGAE